MFTQPLLFCLLRGLFCRLGRLFNFFHNHRFNLSLCFWWQTTVRAVGISFDLCL